MSAVDEALDRIEQHQLAQKKIIRVLEGLPDWDMRWSVIEFLYRLMKKVEDERS